MTAHIRDGLGTGFHVWSDLTNPLDQSLSGMSATHCALEGGFPNWDEFENPAKPPLPRGVNGAGFPCDSLAGFLRGAPMLPSLQELGGRTLLSPVQGASKVTGSSFT